MSEHKVHKSSQCEHNLRAGLSELWSAGLEDTLRSNGFQLNAKAFCWIRLVCFSVAHFANQSLLFLHRNLDLKQWLPIPHYPIVLNK